MSKKAKKNLQKSLEKRRALQQLSADVPSKKTSPTATIAREQAELPSPVSERPMLEEHHSREITRTLVSVLIISALLVGAYIVGKETNYFGTFGDWLYNALKLNS